MSHSKKVAKKVRKLLEHFDVSVSHLSDASGVSERTIRRVLVADEILSTYSPTIDTIDKLAGAFNIPFDKFLAAKPKEVVRLAEVG